VFVVTGHNPSMVEQQNNVLDATLKPGAQYLVPVGGSRHLASLASMGCREGQKREPQRKGGKRQGDD
jgi:hypothetical protein